MKIDIMGMLCKALEDLYKALEKLYKALKMLGIFKIFA